MPTAIDEIFRVAIGHYHARQWVQASQACRQILAEKPNHAPALHLMGLLARRAGDASLCESLFQRSAAAFSNAIASQPNAIEPRLGLAASLREMDRLSESAAAYQQAIAIQPNLPRAQVELGHVLLRLGRSEESIAAYRIAIQLAPTDADARNSLGSALTAAERFAEAEQVFRSALELAPNSAAVWNNLGNLHRVQAQADQAIEAYQHAIASDPSQAAAFSNLGNMLKDQGQLSAAMKALRQAVQLDPDSAAVHSNLAYAACFDPDHDAQAILTEARAWAQRHEAPLLLTHRPHDNDRNPDRRLRIGYVSPDFRSHVVGRNVLPILEHHDHNAFEIHCFSTSAQHDSQTVQFIQAADAWHECAALSDAQLADKIRAMKIDILVDLSLHLAGNRLLTFARKPAPVQITWAGYPGTTGLTSIGYRITDPHLDPPGETDTFYSEASVRLPHSFWCYRPMLGTPEVNSLPAATNGFITFGCLNNPTKITSVSLDLWARVLRQVRNSKLLLVAPEGNLRAAISEQLKILGIDRGRLIFVPPCPAEQHMQRYHLIDISLDPLPYTGHTSTLDSLWMGAPVITLKGQTSVARGSATPLTNLALTEWIASSPAKYIFLAEQFTNDLPRLSDLRRSLRDRMRNSPICDEVQFTRHLETTYRKIWRTAYSESTQANNERY